MRAWLTPDDLPTETKCIQLLVPVGDEWEAIVRGALAPLFDRANFEAYGAVTPEEAEQVFLGLMAQWMSWEECEGPNVGIVGEIRIIIASPIPAGWLFCDGTIYNTSEYPALYQAIGNTFGGEYPDTFAIPDLRGRMCVGYGYGGGLTERFVGDTGGAETVTLDESELPAHDHNLTNTGWLQTNASAGSGQTLLRQTSGSTSTADTGSGEAHENMPPFLVLPYLIYAGT